MLQLKTAGCIAIDNLRKRDNFPPEWQTQEELEELTNRYHAFFLEERFEASRALGAGFFVPELIDRSLRTDEREYMDDPSLPPAKRLEMIRALDHMNNMMMLYPQYIRVIEPSIMELYKQEKRPVQVLELASGAGGLAFALAEQAKTGKLPLEIRGSDIVTEYVEFGNQTAKERQLPLDFQRINAFSMDPAENGRYDIILLSQSLHHFTPGQLARIIVQSRNSGASLFLGLDGHRGLDLLAGVPIIALSERIAALALDGYTSARKFYSETELDLIAEIATGTTRHTLELSWPLSVLRIQL